MRGQDLFEHFTDIDDKIITQAAFVRKKKKPSYMKWGSVAAGFAILIVVGAVYSQWLSNLEIDGDLDTELPMLTLNVEQAGDMGFEGLLAYDISDLVNMNPWEEGAQLTELPVINNDVEVNMNHVTLIEFEEPVALPSAYNFTTNASYEELQEVANYLQEEYSDLIDMEDSVVNISGGDFDIYGNQSYSISFYENSEDMTQSILNYHFDYIVFYGNEEGELWLVRKYEVDISDVIGVYPIINVDTATTLLENGNYITTVPQEFEGIEFIRGVELVYRNTAEEEIFMPCYRFYVELPSYEREDTGLHTYGVYYVPAVEGQYIENMPTWDGEFN